MNCQTKWQPVSKMSIQFATGIAIIDENEKDVNNICNFSNSLLLKAYRAVVFSAS